MAPNRSSNVEQIRRRTRGQHALLVMVLVGGSLAGCAASVSPGASGDTEADARSYSQSANGVYQCLVERGWSVNINWDGEISASSDTIPKAQYSSYEDDSNECWGEVDARILAMSPSEVAGAYEKELATRDCLIELGYTVGEPPSEQTYADRFFSERWTAYGASSFTQSAPSDDEWQRVGKTCVQPSWSFGAAPDAPTKANP